MDTERFTCFYGQNLSPRIVVNLASRPAPVSRPAQRGV